ncbi:MAG: putative toxin-antitoxin system toxin component, PIN family [Clostridium sp.]|jgi:putative PIN family toxin of toxin-antitoxin system|uniref:putative toxin-antitoxin system toxin component, PIN family n=1 Tax=Clostridium sp. TaxID=1506 RepID=UPI0028FE11A1|nr:putative toxin-antitoxin system toxin component, PIN family [Clostridium sp.]MDU1095806.1 putative toxin-antitoxin system toxin component, PIN family [Clostridioides difficile]MDU1125153.1 putative toxin-antitoxin system toxin component, PIN family [Clostridium sp.]MDU3676180.1 putative toxin-antitoxin system toxin component, PIN family [Clostridium sp.]MDU6874022.1 putative toxin-antitoxin system toxin component, PIN family [Clostridium sp.]MDU6935049.1 putative toxin-antitoxin system toxi
MRVVLDTNVFIDAFFGTNENCKLILRKEHNGEFNIIMSKEMNEELIRMIQSSMKKLEMSEDEEAIVYRMLMRALFRTEKIEPKIKFTKCSDKDDNMFFACAIDGNADYIISRDHHIHNLKNADKPILNKAKKEIKILYPDEFVFELGRIQLASSFNNK